MGSGRPLALAIGLLVVGASAEGSALVAPRGASPPGLVARGGAPVRVHRDVVASRPTTRAHRALFSELHADRQLWDADTGVLLRAWGAGAPHPGAVASPALAARGARDLVDRHLAALAPGSSPADFVQVGNVVSGGVRSVGFAQHYRGRPVIGGQVSVRYKADRLVMVGSEALPRVSARLAETPVAADVARKQATRWILDESASASAGAVTGPFILPLVEAGRVREYREVLRVDVDAASPRGRFAVYVDAASGEPVAREQLLRFASGTVAYQVPQRGPSGFRPDFPAPFVALNVDGAPASSDAAGLVTIPDGPPSTVNATAVGTFVRVTNDAGPSALKELSLAPGGVAVWADAADEQVEAQIATYIHANVVKNRVRSIAPGFAYTEQQLPVLVNIADICNAFSDGDQINFFLSGGGCENTGRISDVVYHEWGHSVHAQGIIPGVGLFEGALSEGISDYLASTITDDSGLARGFFLDAPSDPLRESNPPGDEWHWPEDLTGEVHDDGRIIAGTLWDLRDLLKQKLGADPGIARADLIWFESIRRAVDIPTMYPEALLTDDDDGDLTNGTPNECEINLAFNAHGLLGAGAIDGAVLLGAQTPDGFPVTVTIEQGASACVDLEPTGATLRFRVAGSADETEAFMGPAGDGFLGLLPSQADGTLLEYQVSVDLSDGSELAFPQNPGDPWYQLYFGPVTPLYCTSFESPPELAGWTPSGQFEFGPPQGQSGDPAAAFLGGSVAGVNLAGLYGASSSSSLQSPVVDTTGFPTVRLQYRRWLNVEDGVFDQAFIRANGSSAWTNVSGLGSTHTRDEEWRFHDVDVTSLVDAGAIQLEFSLQSDGGLEMGGWNIDQLCLVGTDAAQGPSCGNGVLEAGEGCDAGGENSDTVADACRTDCQPARCGDAVLDSAEGCDDGNAFSGDGCSNLCTPEVAPGTTSATTGDTPTGGFDDGESGASETDGSGESGDTDPGQDSFADRPGCACRSDAAAAPLGLLVLLALRRRRRA